MQDKDTLIAQPYLNLNFRLYEGEGFLNDVTFQLTLAAGIAIPILLLYLGEGAKKQLKSPGAPTAAQHP